MAAPVGADSTVLVAALVSWHERHEEAAAAIEAALARKALVLAEPVLVETYAILTLLPAQHRLTHADAFHVLRSSFATAKIALPKAREVWTALRRWSVASVGGGDAHDAQIVEIARDGGAKTFLTFRKAELERLAIPGIELVEPV